MLSRILAWITPAVLVFVVSSCQGQENTPSGSASVSSGLLGEWTDVDLEKKMSRNGYGANPKEIMVRGSDGVLIYTPETPQDHVATAFIELPAHDGDRSLELSVNTTVAGGESCAANLQDQALNLLATVSCKGTGAQQVLAKVPASVKSVRVYFQGATRQPMRLPTHMRLSELR